MKFTPEVIAALQTLKDYAENDFERHRVETLERDLTSPPVAEVIDDNHQRFNGQIYRKQKSGHYHHNFGIHVAIWRYYHGDIPAGYEIHHDNGNPADNSPTNLILLTKSEHRKKHNDNCQGKKYICEYCGKTFYSNSTQKTVRFCSKICASNYRYKFEATYKKICPTCGKEFYSSVEHIKYCSQECSTAGQKTIQLHYCPICGKTFKPKKSSAIYCSHSCASKASAKKRCKHFVEYEGETISLVEASEKSGINYDTLVNRFYHGDTGEKLFRPARQKITPETPETC